MTTDFSERSTNRLVENLVDEAVKFIALIRHGHDAQSAPRSSKVI